MIRLATKEDFNFIYGCYMHPQVNPYLLYEDMDAESFLPIFDNLILQSVKYIYATDNKNVGMFKLIPLQHRNHHIAYLGGLAIHPSFAGKGEGRKMLEAIIKLICSNGFLRIELSVAATNRKAIQLYEKLGYEKEGVLGKFTHLKSEGRFIDEVMMALIF